MVSTSNNDTISRLSKLVQTGNLSHAYLFFGEAKDEMKKEALAIARELEGGAASVDVESYTLIDSSIIDASEKNSLGIDIVREIKNFLWQKPLKSKKRTVVILGAEELTREAQNAILKILEDPPRTALIILVATTLERLLTTITSRLQKVFIATKSDNATSKKPIANERARKLADKFLRSSVTERRLLAKEITDEEKEGSQNLTVVFIDELITLLSEKPKENSLFLKELLYRRRVMGEYSLNKRLQLAFLCHIWYNS